jgi:hypothetical protein
MQRTPLVPRMKAEKRKTSRKDERDMTKSGDEAGDGKVFASAPQVFQARAGMRLVCPFVQRKPRHAFLNGNGNEADAPVRKKRAAAARVDQAPAWRYNPAVDGKGDAQLNQEGIKAMPTEKLRWTRNGKWASMYAMVGKIATPVRATICHLPTNEEKWLVKWKSGQLSRLPAADVAASTNTTTAPSPLLPSAPRLADFPVPISRSPGSVVRFAAVDGVFACSPGGAERPVLDRRQ